MIDQMKIEERGKTGKRLKVGKLKQSENIERVRENERDL